MIRNIFNLLVIVVSTLFVFLAGLLLFEKLQYYMYLEDANYVSVEELIRSPELYDKNQVCTVGEYTSGRETSVLQAINSFDPTSQYNSMIWIDSPVDMRLFDRIKVQLLNQDESIYTTVTVHTCGMFE